APHRCTEGFGTSLLTAQALVFNAAIERGGGRRRGSADRADLASPPRLRQRVSAPRSPPSARPRAPTTPAPARPSDCSGPPRPPLFPPRAAAIPPRPPGRPPQVEATPVTSAPDRPRLHRSIRWRAGRVAPPVPEARSQPAPLRPLASVALSDQAPYRPERASAPEPHARPRFLSASAGSFPDRALPERYVDPPDRIPSA